MTREEAAKILSEMWRITEKEAEAVDIATKALKEDVAPAKHGEWLGAYFDGYADGNPVYNIWACSVCHAEVESEGEPPGFRYCPYCGAKMEDE